MTVRETTAPDQATELSFEIELAHPPHKVWRALTTPSLLSEWLLPVVEHRLEPGAAFRFQAPAQPGWDGVVVCRYLEIEEPTRLRWAWIVGELDTVVTASLAPTSTGTRLSLVQTGFKAGQKQNFGGARYGWKLMSRRLVDLLAGLDGTAAPDDDLPPLT